MPAQIIRNSNGISNIVYTNRHRKWVSLPIAQHLRYTNLVERTGEWCEELLDQVIQGRRSRSDAIKAIQGKFKKLQNELLNW